MKRIHLIAVMALIWMACGQKADTGSSTEEGVLPVTQEQAGFLINHYLLLKNSMVEADTEWAQNEAKSMLDALGQAEGEYLQEFSGVLSGIMGSSDIEEQRAAFEEVSALITPLVKASDRTIYKQFCPMAFDNRGAYWYSNEKEIVNPYFGDAMLHCGRLVED